MCNPLEYIYSCLNITICHVIPICDGSKKDKYWKVSLNTCDYSLLRIVCHENSEVGEKRVGGSVIIVKTTFWWPRHKLFETVEFSGILGWVKQDGPYFIGCACVDWQTRPVARFKVWVGKNKFLVGQDFCFYYIFKTIFSKHNKIRGNTTKILRDSAPECPPPWLRACDKPAPSYQTIEICFRLSFPNYYRPYDA